MVQTRKMVAEIDGMELACRIAEGCLGVKRPEGATAAQAMAHFDEESRQGFIQSAYNASEYLTEVVNNLKDVQ